MDQSKFLITPTEIAELQQLEESLWIAATRFNDDYMERILAPEFFEFGRSGRFYERADTLGIPSQPINALLPLQDFQVHQIENNVVLVTYRTQVTYGDDVQLGRRSSLWIKNAAGWQLRFHQGTPIAN